MSVMPTLLLEILAVINKDVQPINYESHLFNLIDVPFVCISVVMWNDYRIFYLLKIALNFTLICFAKLS